MITVTLILSLPLPSLVEMLGKNKDEKANIFNTQFIIISLIPSGGYYGKRIQ